MRQREKINYSHCRQFSTFRAGKYNYTQFTTAWEYLISTNIHNERYNINDSMYKWPKKIEIGVNKNLSTNNMVQTGSTYLPSLNVKSQFGADNLRVVVEMGSVCTQPIYANFCGLCERKINDCMDIFKKITQKRRRTKSVTDWANISTKILIIHIRIYCWFLNW